MRNQMYGLNLELTTCCPLHCPQCYCTLEGGKHLDINTAKEKLSEAAEHGVKVVHLSGGETMCYPYIFELVKYATSLNIKANVALSGYKFNTDVLNRFVNSGVNGIFISLNGSTREINGITRDGFNLAINALEVLKNNNYPNTYLNWVMHSSNAEDFENVISIAEKYDVTYLMVLMFKPDSRHELKSFPNKEQIITISKTIKNYTGPVKIGIETCFSQLLAVHLDTPLFGNLNVGSTKGCRAGIYNYNVNVDGLYSPCRHLDYFEQWDSLDDYLENSPIIQKIRKANDEKREPCASCKYGDYCRHCLAINSKINGDIYLGNNFCSLWQ